MFTYQTPTRHALLAAEKTGLKSDEMRRDNNNNNNNAATVKKN